jgi:hypothetical protein
VPDSAVDPSQSDPIPRREAANSYELAFDEARRALDGQERALTAFRTRAGVIFSAAAIVTSFLGGQALDAHGFTTLAWLAIVAFAVLGVAALFVLWPDDAWEFDAVPNQIISSYIERPDEPPDEIHIVHRDLALHMENSYLANERRRLRPLRWAFRLSVVALVVEVALWLAALATGT